MARTTDETGRVFLFEPKNKTEVLPVLTLGFTLPKVAYTDTQIDIRTSGHNNTLPMEWTLTKDGKVIALSSAIEAHPSLPLQNRNHLFTLVMMSWLIDYTFGLRRYGRFLF